jgi:hypothetical protein
MGRARLPGPMDTDSWGICRLDGTVSVTRMAIPAPLGSHGGVGDVAGMDLEDRFIEVLKRTAPLLPGDIQEQFLALLAPKNLLIMAGTLAAWAASHYFGIGEIIDLLLLIGGFVALGYQVFSAASDFATAIKLTGNAQSSHDLDQAAQYMAKFVAVVGVAIFTALVMKGAKRIAPAARGAIATMAARATRGLSGKHFVVFQEVAQEMKMIIGVRFTNPKSTQWIDRGFPAKPIEIKIKTSKTTGLVTALNEAEVATAKQKGFFVVGEDGVARNAAGHELKLDRAEWPVEEGQVIHPVQHKPLVGDYDLAGVIDPAAKGRNIQLAASDGQVMQDWNNPVTRKVAAELNSRMDQPRVMHGAHDGFFDEPGDAVFFMPDGTVVELDTAAKVKAFYEGMGRQTIRGSYNPH